MSAVYVIYAGAAMTGIMIAEALFLLYAGRSERRAAINRRMRLQEESKLSQEQVLIVLGTPSTVATVSGEAFYYISQRGEKAAAFLPQKVIDQRVVAVYFDKERRVTRLADYGMKDGKIHDFISRTTPTGGAELSYLTYIFKIIGTQ